MKPPRIPLCGQSRLGQEADGRRTVNLPYMGEQQVKNIAKPVRAYSVRLGPGAAAHLVTKAKAAPDGAGAGGLSITKTSPIPSKITLPG